MSSPAAQPELPFALRTVRAALRRLNSYLSRKYRASQAAAHPMPRTARGPDYAAAEAALRRVQPGSPAAKAYLATHIPRLARTLELTPPSRTSGRILELGCYMQITPVLGELRGYTEVRGAHYGPLGQSESKTAEIDNRPFDCIVDLFDAERDVYPYPDGHFETVLACELIEHMIYDPMHLLLECRRVLEDGGRLLLTTPNVASLTSVWRTLHGYGNPQIFYQYTRPAPGAAPDIQHMREYTAYELRDAVRAAGFEVETLLTEPIEKFSEHLPVWNFLEEHGFNTAYRGEQTYCVAVKRAGLPITRFPTFMYYDGG